MSCLGWDFSLVSLCSRSSSGPDMPSASGVAYAAAVTITMIERQRNAIDPMEIKEIADHWQRLKLAKQAVADAQQLYARSLSIVQESQALLREIDDVSGSTARSVR